MKTILLLLGLMAAALAKIPSQSWEEENFGVRGQLEQTSFKRGGEYEFNYNGQIASGIPGSSRQHSATRLQAHVSLVLKGEDKAILAIRNIRMGKLNDRLSNPRAMVPFMAFQEVELSEEMKQELQLPVMFSYQQGVVSELVFDGQERPWSANIKRGILNMLQVNLGKRGEVKQSEEAQVLNETPSGRQSSHDKSMFESFATHEQTVEGDCETFYTVVSNPSNPRHSQEILNVTRTIEFENCKRRPEIKYNFRFQDPCEACDPKFTEDKFVKSSSVAKFNISGNREEFLIESAMVESQYQVVPFNREGNVISTYVNQTLVLTRSGPIRSKNIRQPQNGKQSDSDLEFTMDWEKEMEEFLMKGQDQARLPVDIKERVKIVSEILRPLLSEMRDTVSDQAPIHYAQLVKILRLTEKSQLQEIARHFFNGQPESFSQEEHHKIKGLLTDALADAATKDSISFLFQLIKEKKLSPIRAAVTVKQLVHIRTPSKQIVQEFLELLDSQVVRENWMLKQSVQLTLGSVVAGLCMPTEDRLAVNPRPSFDKTPRRLAPNSQLCPQQLQEQLIQKFFNIVEQKMDDEEEAEEAILALKTIGNMGIPKSILRLEQLIRNKSTKNLIRIEAILALRQLRESLPQKVTEILMPVFMNKQEWNEIRVAAAYQLLQTLPGRPVLDQMARSLFTERSRQVASFVFTYMNTLANSSNPCEAKFARNLQLALRHGRKISGAFLPQFSKYLHGSVYSQKYRAGADVNLATVISNRTFVPQFFGVNLHLTALGFWSKNFVGLSVTQENMEDLVARYLRRTDLSDLSLDQILSRSGSSRSAGSSLKELKNIWQQLSTVARQAQQQQGIAKAFASLKLKDQEFFMLPISGKTLNMLPSVQEIRRMLQEGTHFNIHKAAILHEMEHKIPTSMGFPLIFNIRIPTVSKISGQVRLESNSKHYKLELNNVKPSVASSLFMTVSVWNPIVSSGVKIVATAKVATPMSGSVEIEMKQGEPELRVVFEPEQKQVEYLKIETRPMTWTRKYSFPLTSYPEAEYKSISGEEWNRVNNIRESKIIRKVEQFVQQVTGQRLSVQGIWHRTPLSGPNSLPVCPFSGPNYISIRSEGDSSEQQKFVLKVTAKMNKGKDQMEQESFEMEGEEINQEQLKEKKAYETVIKSELFTQGGRNQRKAQMETRLSFSPSLRTLKGETEIKISPIPELSQEEVMVCSRAFIQYPKSAQSFSQLRGKNVVAQLKTTWGSGRCQEDNKVQIKMSAKHSQLQQQQWETDQEFSYWQTSESQRQQEPENFSPLQQQDSLNRAQQLHQYNIEAQYHNLHPVLKNVTAKIFRAVKAYYYWNTDVMNWDIQNPSNRIQAQITLNPQNRQLFNLTVRTPVENVTMVDAKLPLGLRVIRSLSVSNLQSQIESPADILDNVMGSMLPVCRISSQRLQTFDGVSIRAPLSDCWTLLAKDCDSESQPAYAVLVKKQQQQDEMKVVKIVTPENTIQLIPQQSGFGSIKVKVNGQEQDMPHSSQQVQIQKSEEEQMVKVTLKEAGVRVSFDGYSVKVQTSPAMSGRQCGICGNSDGEDSNEFQTPKNVQVSDIRRFIQAHTIKDDKCNFPEQLNQIDESSEELSFEPRWKQQQDWQADSTEGDYQDKSQDESSEEWDQEDSLSPVERLAVEESGHKICVSTQTIPRCPLDSFPEQYESEKRELQFRCIPRSHSEAHRILRIVQQQQQLPSELQQVLSQQEASYTNSLPVPKRCSRL